MTARCERFARQLHGRFTRPAYLVDERYTSVEAAKTLAGSKLAGQRRKQAIDEAAAYSAPFLRKERSVDGLVSRNHRLIAMEIEQAASERCASRRRAIVRRFEDADRPCRHSA